VTSTNSVLAELARQGAPDGLVLVADYQSAGRGRLDRRWESPAGKSLLVSVLLRPEPAWLPPARHHLAVAACALALADACERATGVSPRLKWPNDLVVGDLKLAGLLAEGPGDGSLVVGAGLNVGWAPPGQAATCLEAAAGQPVDRGELLVDFLLGLGSLYGRWPEVLSLYRQRCSTIGREVAVEHRGVPGELRGRAVAVDDNGRLVVQDSTSGAQVVVAVGDVVHAHHV